VELQLWFDFYKLQATPTRHPKLPINYEALIRKGSRSGCSLSGLLGEFRDLKSLKRVEMLWLVGWLLGGRPVSKAAVVARLAIMALVLCGGCIIK
jgi:hypothetical protein